MLKFSLFSKIVLVRILFFGGWDGIVIIASYHVYYAYSYSTVRLWVWSHSNSLYKHGLVPCPM